MISNRPFQTALLWGFVWARRLLLLLAIALVAANAARAMRASPHPIEERQPDGTPIELRLRGDEHVHWLEDARGFAVVRQRGRFVYAAPDAAGNLAATPFLVGRDDPERAGLRRNVRPAPQRAEGTISGADAQVAPAAVAASGEVRNLVVLLRFANHRTRALPTQSQVDVLFNAAGDDPALAPTGSVRAAYLEYSYGQVQIDSTVARWVDLPQTEQYYAAGQSGLTSRTHDAIRFALAALDADPNFRFADFDRDRDGAIDAITFLHSGYGAEWGGTDSSGTVYPDRIWSHKWSLFSPWSGSEGVRVADYNISPALWGRSGSAIGRIGVIAHELGHFFGLPDLYDTDGSPGEGIGSWCLMANSWGFDGSQLFPPHPSAWSKIQLGWLTATPIAAGLHAIDAAEIAPAVHQVDAGYPAGEYLLIENRQPIGLDADIPQGGIAIWHIDDRASFNDGGYPGQPGFPENGNHYRVALLQADGRYDLERGVNRGDGGDLYHAGGVSALGPDGWPNTDAYQGGNVFETGITVSEVSAAGAIMTFRLGSFEAECADGLDNDEDGRIDFPEDPGCEDGLDGDEAEDAENDGIADRFDNCLEVANPSQLDTDRDGYGNACDADYNDDGMVGGPDWVVFARAFGATSGSLRFDPEIDADGDGVIGSAEFRLAAGSLGRPPGPSGLSCRGTAPCGPE